MTELELNEKLDEIIFESGAGSNAKEWIMQLIRTYQAQDRERIARALEKKKKHFAQLAMTEDVYAWNAAMTQAIVIVQGTEEEGK